MLSMALVKAKSPDKICKELTKKKYVLKMFL